MVEPDAVSAFQVAEVATTGVANMWASYDGTGDNRLRVSPSAIWRRTGRRGLRPPHPAYSLSSHRLVLPPASTGSRCRSATGSRRYLRQCSPEPEGDRKSTRLNSSH